MGFNVAANDAFAQVTATEGQTLLTADFPILSASELLVIRTRAGVDAALVLGDDYSVSGVKSASGFSVTLEDAAEAGDVYTFLRETVAARVDDRFSTSGEFTGEGVNQALDRLTMLAQELRRGISRCVRLPDSEAAVEMSVPPSSRRGRVFVYDDVGRPALAMTTADQLDALNMLVLGASADYADVFNIITPERFGYVDGGSLSGNTQAVIDAIVFAAGRTVTFRPNHTYVVGRVIIENSVHLDFNGATFSLSGSGAGFVLSGAGISFFVAKNGKIIGSGDPLVPTYGIVAAGSGTVVGTAIIQDMYVQDTVQGIETSAFKYAWVTRNRVLKIVGTVSGQGYGFVTGNAGEAGGADEFGVQYWTDNIAEQCGRHGFYFGRFHNYFVNGATVIDHALGQDAQAGHSGFAVSRGSRLTARGVRFYNCADEGVSIDDDTSLSGHCADIDIEFETHAPQGAFVAFRAGAGAAGANNGLDRIRVRGALDLNGYAVRDVQVVHGLNMDLAFKLYGDKNFPSEKVVVEVVGDTSASYFGRLSLTLTGVMTGTSNLFPVKLYAPASTADCNIHIENNVINATVACAFDQVPTNDALVVTRNVSDNGESQGFHVYALSQAVGKGTVFAHGKHGGYGAGFVALSQPSDQENGPDVAMGGVYFDGEAAFTATGSTQTAAMVGKVIKSGAMVEVFKASGLTKLFTLLNGFQLVMPTATPVSAAASGTAGQWSWDENYIYVCVATDTWKRVALASW